MFEAIIERNTLNPKETELVAGQLIDDPGTLEYLAENKATDPSAAKAVAYYENIAHLTAKKQEAHATRQVNEDGRTPQEARVKQAIDDMSIEGELKSLADRAYALSRKNGEFKGVSPATMEMAHDALQNEMVEKMKQPGADLPVLSAQSEYLFRVYANLDILSDGINEKTGKKYFSYTDANAERGIKPKKVEKFEM
jgi:hypothetical protein